MAWELSRLAADSFLRRRESNRLRLVSARNANGCGGILSGVPRLAAHSPPVSRLTGSLVLEHGRKKSPGRGNRSSDPEEAYSQEFSDSTTPPIAYNPDSPNPKQPEDANLVHLIEAWPNLPHAVRAGIVAMVRAASQ